ncbi:hypothetical protein R6Q59_028770 [Mikania micrantha]
MPARAPAVDSPPNSHSNSISNRKIYLCSSSASFGCTAPTTGTRKDLIRALNSPPLIDTVT